VRILKPEIVEPSAWQPTDALTHISQTKDKGHTRTHTHTHTHTKTLEKGVGNAAHKKGN